MAIRARNGAVLAAIEAVEGTPETLSFVDDAILVADPTITLSPQNETTNEVTGSLDDRGPIVGGMQVSVSFDVYLKGSGTAGVAPEWGVLLRALGWAEVSTAAAVPVSPEAATAGTTTSATGGAGFTATADLYRGMPMELTVNPVGGALTFISDYTVGKLMTFTDVFGSALDVTTLLQIPANVIYKPASTGISSLTLGVYFDGVRYLIAGARGDQSLVLTAAKAGKFSFTFQGIFMLALAWALGLSLPRMLYGGIQPMFEQINAAHHDLRSGGLIACDTHGQGHVNFGGDKRLSQHRANPGHTGGSLCGHTGLDLAALDALFAACAKKDDIAIRSAEHH